MQALTSGVMHQASCVMRHAIRSVSYPLAFQAFMQRMDWRDISQWFALAIPIFKLNQILDCPPWSVLWVFLI